MIKKKRAPHIPQSPRVAVKVTKQIIERSTRKNSKSCMIAEGIKRAVPKATQISVDLATCRFTDPEKGLRYIYLTPRTGQFRLLQFDQGFKPEPFGVKLARGQVVKAQIKKAPTDSPKRKGHGGYTLKHARAARARIPKRAVIRVDGNTIYKTGGKAPPQMRTKRGIGIKAFVGGFESKAAAAAAIPPRDRS